MKPPNLEVGEEFQCDSCGTRSEYLGHCVRSVHCSTPDGFIHFCDRRCFFTTLATGARLLDGRIILVLSGQSPVEILRGLFRRHHLDDLDPATAPAARVVEAIASINFEAVGPLTREKPMRTRRGR